MYIYICIFKSFRFQNFISSSSFIRLYLKQTKIRTQTTSDKVSLNTCDIEDGNKIENTLDKTDNISQNCRLNSID